MDHPNMEYVSQGDVSDPDYLISTVFGDMVTSFQKKRIEEFSEFIFHLMILMAILPFIVLPF